VSSQVNADTCFVLLIVTVIHIACAFQKEFTVLKLAAKRNENELPILGLLKYSSGLGLNPRLGLVMRLYM
jgi:hypothetical protein